MMKGAAESGFSLIIFLIASLPFVLNALSNGIGACSQSAP